MVASRAPPSAAARYGADSIGTAMAATHLAAEALKLMELLPNPWVWILRATTGASAVGWLVYRLVKERKRESGRCRKAEKC